MMVFLNTQFNEDEAFILMEFINHFNMEVSIVYSVDTDKLTGVNCPNRMISVGGLFLVEEKDETQEWYMGDKNGDTYDFWGNYGNLKDALNGL